MFLVFEPIDFTRLSQTTTPSTFDPSTQFDLIFNAIPDLVFWKDRSLNILGGNAAFRKFVGEDFIGKKLPEFINPTDSIILEQSDMQVMGTSETLEHIINIEDPQQEMRWFSVTKSPVLCSIHGCIGVLVIMSDITKQKNSEEAQEKLVEELKQTNEELQYVKGQLLHAQENERKKISSELHDDLGQHFTLLKFALQKEKVNEESLSLLDDGIERIRLLSRNISPIYLQNNDLSILVGTLVQRLNNLNSGITFEYTFPDNMDGINDQIKLHFFRIIQECCNNVMKHSKGTSCKILIDNSDGLCLEVKDDGEPYSFEEQSKKDGSFGLLTIRERVKGMNGKINYMQKGDSNFNTLQIKLAK